MYNPFFLKNPPAIRSYKIIITTIHFYSNLDQKKSQRYSVNIFLLFLLAFYRNSDKRREIP
jgi:hypothetical protein